MSNEHLSQEAKKILQTMAAYVPEMEAVRHDLHAHPEIAYEEHRTAKVIADLLNIRVVMKAKCTLVAMMDTQPCC